MNRSYWQSLSSLRVFMILLNFIIIVFYGSVFLLATKYVIDYQMTRDFLDKINHIPHHPLVVFFGSILLFIILLSIMYYRQKHDIIQHKMNMVLSFVELLICFGIIYLLYMGYNGIILLVFCNSIYHLKDDKTTKWILGAVILVYLISNYDVFSTVIPITNPQAYFQIFNANIRGMLMVAKNVLETLNILLFIVYMILYIADQIQENENISKELDMIHQVNRELQNYAAVTEKIGENNERKRLAREIHDTLGHALTGIAAGVDACIAMIDINPQATKQQLQVVSKVVRQGIGDVRNSLNKLRPGALEAHGFKGAIESMIEEFMSVSDLDIVLDYRLEKVDFENTKEDILFRVIQESITNSLRHGGATHIEIIIYQEDYHLYLKIQDNGSGCEDIHYGFGLKQMQERVAVINGEVTYDGHNGFLTIIKIPMQRGENYD
ncbi:MAG: sensor histidine kinase [Longibaculum sp.]